MDPDQLASSADLDLHCVQERELMSAWFYTVFQSVNYFSTERYKLICTIGQLTYSLDKYIMAIYLSLDK